MINFDDITGETHKPDHPYIIVTAGGNKTKIES